MKKTILSLSLLISATFGAKATTVFSDSFSYPDGGIVANTSGLWFNNTGTAGSSVVTNQQLLVSTSRSEDIATRLPSTFTTNGPVTALYASFTLKCVGLPSLGGAYFTHFSGTNAFGTLSGFRARLWATTTNVSAGNTNTGTQFMLSIANSGISGATNGQWIAPLETNTTYTVVTRYVLATGMASLWINPTAESDTSVTGNDTVPSGDFGSNGLPTNGPINITHYSFRQATGEGTMQIDDLKIGTSFNDVAGANTAPTISSILNQKTPSNTAVGPISFIIGDSETAASSLTVTTNSSNQTLVPNSNISLGGSGANRTITINPASNQQGSAVITVSVSDGVNVTSTEFTITVGAPSISAIPSQITSINQSATVPFTISDTESAASSLIVTTSSSNTGLVPEANIVQGGNGSNRTLTITPAADQTGSSIITVSVSDGINTTQTTFGFTVKVLYGLVFSDEFNYADGSLFQNSDVWHSHSGTGSEMQVLNGAAVVNSSLTEDLNASLTNGPFAANAGVVLYCSFTLSNSSLPNVSGDYFMHYKDAAQTFRCKIFASTTNAASGSFRVGVANNGNVIDAASQFPLDIPLNGTCTVVTRYNVGTGESRLWINPNSENDLSVGASDSLLTATVAAIAFRETTGIGVENVDNLKIGTSYTDVMTVTNVAPQPTLSIAKSGSDIQISWPTNSADYVLESTAVLGTTWTTAGGSPAVSGTNYVLTIGSPTGNLFYRLKK